MTQGVYMVILEFIQSHQKEFAEFCGDESIAWDNYSDFKKWLEERDKSDAELLYKLNAKNERLEKEADWLADLLQIRCYNSDCKEHCCFDRGCNCPVSGHIAREYWRNAAHEAVEKEE